jgi:hypothetical protein
LIEQDSQSQSQEQTTQNKADRKNGCIAHIDQEALVVKDQIRVLL